jgi:hypothetical protein
MFDVDNKEIEILEDIRDIFKKYKLNIKEKSGANYGDLV